MDSRERIRRIIAGEPADRTGFWLGNPHADSWPAYLRYFGAPDEEAVRRQLGDDFRWVQAGEYLHPQARDQGLSLGPFQIPGKLAHGMAGPLAHCREVAELDDYPWPTLAELDFTGPLARLRQAGPFYRASGFWASFYHNIMDLFGMENYMMNMYLHPELVHAVTDRVCSFYYEANELWFDAAGPEMDGYFFGNDFGTQLDLICGPKQFDEFIMPWFRQFTAQAKRRGYQVILHSCGSVYKVIERLIAAGVDCLHPIQALAAHMDAATLAHSFGGRIAFLGGIDTQDLLVHATPAQVEEDVRRVQRLLGPRLIVSPSHEAILPNVPPENVAAMARAAVAPLLSARA